MTIGNTDGNRSIRGKQIRHAHTHTCFCIVVPTTRWMRQRRNMEQREDEFTANTYVYIYFFIYVYKRVCAFGYVWNYIYIYMHFCLYIRLCTTASTKRAFKIWNWQDRKKKGWSRKMVAEWITVVQSTGEKLRGHFMKPRVPRSWHIIHRGTAA